MPLDIQREGVYRPSRLVRFTGGVSDMIRRIALIVSWLLIAAPLLVHSFGFVHHVAAAVAAALS